MDEALAEMRVLLLEASVPTTVTSELLGKVKARAAEKPPDRAVSPSKALQNIVYGEVAAILRRADARLEIKGSPYKILLVGLQGAGKTTAVAKLARYLKIKMKKTTVVASADIHRPAAQEQLETLAGQIGVKFIRPEKMDEAAIIKRAVAAVGSADVLIMDSAGRSPSKKDAIAAAEKINRLFKPNEILLTLDAAAGQSAAEVVEGFQAALPMHGAILTRLDGDAAGGATLAVSAAGVKIKFVSDGEGVESFADFSSKRLAARILGFEAEAMSQLEEIFSEDEEDEEQAFDLNAFAKQLDKMAKSGGLQKLAQLLPNLPSMPVQSPAEIQVDEKMVRAQRAIISSMTPIERKNPKIIKFSRRRRIAEGAGVKVEDVNVLLRRFQQAVLMMRRHGGEGGLGPPPKSDKRRLAFRP